MNPFRAWGLAATAALGVATPVLASPPAGQTTLFAKIFGPSKPKAAAATTRTAPKPPAPPSVDAVASALRVEQEAWDRRMTVCNKLREIAIATNDEALLKSVDELERKEAALYTARTAALGLPKATSMPIESTADIQQAAKKLTAPANPVGIDPAVRTAEARTPNDVIREVRP